MMIKEVCEICGVTKKAIEYYEKIGIISPKKLDNGYREFDSEDLKKIEEISLLRKLDIPVLEIRSIIDSKNKIFYLEKYKTRQELKLEQEKIKKEVLDFLIDNQYGVNEAREILNKKLSNSITIKEKLLDAFPEHYGYFLLTYFGRFLNGKIETKEQEEAYKNIVEFLDSVNELDIPTNIEKHYKDYFDILPAEKLETINNDMKKNINEAINNTEKYLDDKKEFMEEYIKYKESDEYKNSDAYKIKESLLKFNKTSGYYDIFIKNLKILSPSYKKYQDDLEKADKILRERYPQTNEWYK